MASAEDTQSSSSKAMASAEQAQVLKLELRPCKTMPHFKEFVGPVNVPVSISQADAVKIIQNHKGLVEERNKPDSGLAPGHYPNGQKVMMKIEVPLPYYIDRRPVGTPKQPSDAEKDCDAYHSFPELKFTSEGYKPVVYQKELAPAPAAPAAAAATSEKREKVRDKLMSRFIQALYEVAMIDDQRYTRAEANKKLWDLFDDFQNHVMPTAEKWFIEQGLKEEEKTLKESRQLTEGAGGIKILCGNDFIIKVPEQYTLLYGNCYWLAYKAAKHEHRYADMMIPGIFQKIRYQRYERNDILAVPAPSILVDYLGYRVLVALYMNIHQTVIGRKGIQPGLPAFNKEVGGWLNELLQDSGLKPHKVQAGKEVTPDGEECTLPCDIEVMDILNLQNEHMKKPKQVYGIVDCARLGVPTPTRGSRTNVAYYLVHHMRRELIKRYYAEHGVKLSCDAFIKGTEGNPLSLDEEDKEVREAYKSHLKNEPIDRVAKKLCELPCDVYAEDLVWIVHNQGLNLRNLGDVYNKLTEIACQLPNTDPKSRNAFDWRQRIVVEVTARTFRRAVNDMLRNIVKSGDVLETTLKKQIAAMFNLVLGEAAVLQTVVLGVGGSSATMLEQSQQLYKNMGWWKQECFPILNDTSSSSEWSRLELKREYLVQEGYLLENFLWVASNLLGVQWAPALWQHRRTPSFFTQRKLVPFNDTLVLAVRPRVVLWNAAYHSLGMVLDSTQDHTVLGLEQTARSFRQALDRQPANTYTMNRLARTLEELAKVKHDMYEKDKSKIQEKEEAQRLRQQSRFLNKMAVEVPNAPSAAYFTFGAQCEEDFFEEYKKAKEQNGGHVPDWDDLPDHVKQLWQKAVNAYQEASKRGDAHACIMLADLLRVKGAEPGDMLKCFEVNVKRGVNALYHMFVLYLEQGNWAEAAKTAEELLKKAQKPDFHDTYMIEQVKKFVQYLQSAAKRQ